MLAILLLSFQTLPSSQPEQVVALASQHHIKDNTMAAVARYLYALEAPSMPAWPVCSVFRGPRLVPPTAPSSNPDSSPVCDVSTDVLDFCSPCFGWSGGWR